jgi:hypothetical protein
LINNEDWGDPRTFSMTVNRKGDGLETEYSVVPSPANPTPDNVLQAYKDRRGPLADQLIVQMDTLNKELPALVAKFKPYLNLGVI